MGVSSRGGLERDGVDPMEEASAPGNLPVSRSRLPRPTIRDVSRQAGVSPTTVSHALSGKGRVDATTRARVRAVAQRLGYRPSVRAQRLREGRARTVALVNSLPGEITARSARMEYLLHLAAASSQEALLRGYAVVLVPPTDDLSWLECIDIDGAIVNDPLDDDRLVRALEERGLPVVTVGRAPHGTCPYVAHGPAGTGLLLAHLVDQGATRIALLTSSSSRATALGVREAYLAWSRERSLAPIVATLDERAAEEAGRQATLTLLEREPAIDAIYAPLDAFAVGALRALRELRRRVPRDVLVATHFDGARARASRPQLTALDLQLDRVGLLALDLLLAEIEHRPHPGWVPEPTPRLIPRGTTLRRRPGP